ncbi:MAG TPA: hypothetical protein VM386_07140 [Acidimicrobiales bacterium]|nr:hypothetical protein [Acidimicrobiales bacterium]
MALVDDAGLGQDPSVSITTSAPSSVVSAGQMTAVVRDTSTSTWEEIELTLGRESTMTAPKVVVMALVGTITAAGILTGALHVVVGAIRCGPGAIGTAVLAQDDRHVEVAGCSTARRGGPSAAQWY